MNNQSTQDTTNNAKHTPLPWKIYPDFDLKLLTIGHHQYHANLVETVLELPWENLSNARLIVQAVNSHHELIEALERATNWLEHFIKYDHLSEFGPTAFAVSEARKALSKAKGGE